MPRNDQATRSSWKLLLAVCTALGATAWAVASNWGDIMDFHRDVRSAATRYKTRPTVDPMATTRLRTLLAAETTPVSLDRTKYWLALDVKASYEPAQSTDEADLRSLSPLSMHVPQSFVLNQTMSESINNENIRWTFWGQSATLLTELYFSTGPKTWRLSLDENDWRREYMATQTNNRVRGAVVQLVLDKPEWLVLASVRLLEAADPNVHVLEITLRNHTRSEFLIEHFHLDARQPRPTDGPRCGTYGIVGDPPQKLDIDWHRVVKTSAADGVWTTFAETLVNVVATLSYGKCRGEHHYFSARIPSRMSVKPGEKLRYAFRVRQIGELRAQQAGRPRGFRLFGGLPRLRLPGSNPLAGISANPLLWERVEVGIGGDGEVSPRRLRLATNSSAR